MINFLNFITTVVYKKLLIPNFLNQLFHYFPNYYFLSNSVRINAQNIDTLSVNENYIIKANSTLNSKAINSTSSNNTVNDKSGTIDNVPWPSKVKLDLRTRTKIANDSNADYYVLGHTSAVSILTELAFISNPKEENILNNTVYQNKFANALDIGIVNAINNKNS